MSSSSLSPIRIYILWHPGFDCREEFKDRDPKSLDDKEKAKLDRGLKLARRIYHWFRMENMEGIPVYFRSAPKAGSDTGLPLDIHDLGEKDVRNYIIPLVDAHMVSCPEWRRYVTDLADKNDDSTRFTKSMADGKSEFRVLPVAVESVAYNMPESMRHLNFIRHIPRDEAPPDDMELLAKLTEVLCRDLRFWLQRQNCRQKKSAAPATASVRSIPDKIKIFLSHAKADETKEAIAIKEFIQRETQCEAFFDETDIASGYNFAAVLGDAIGGGSAGLIVVQGDNYADRPWCRKEIRDFLKPVRDPLVPRSRHLQYFIPPVIVVQTMKGKQIGRTIPELGYSPCVRWENNPARFVVTTLLREILFGLFYRILALRVAESEAAANHGTGMRRRVYINRAPDPVMVNRILKDLNASTVKEIVHPGYGLSTMEKEGLESSIRGIRFRPFLKSSAWTGNQGNDLAGKILAVSAGNPGDILSRGMGDEHIQEHLVRLLRPLVARQASLIYGGRMPGSMRSETPWNDPVNFTGALIQILVTERDTHGNSGKGLASRLFNPRPWNERGKITVQDIAQWTDICSFITVPMEGSGIEIGKLPSKPKPPADEGEYFDDRTDHQKLQLRTEYKKALAEYEAAGEAGATYKALCLSAMRMRICDSENPLRCELPDEPDDQSSSIRDIAPLAHILIGGKTSSFSGIMPGVFEEALRAFDSENPVFIVPESGGAAALLAKWLLDFKARPKSPPDIFTVEYYRHDKTYAAFLTGLEHDAFVKSTTLPVKALGDLWRHVMKATDPVSLARLLNNRLSGDDNVRLLQSDSCGEICGLVWKGISAIVDPKKPA